MPSKTTIRKGGLNLPNPIMAQGEAPTVAAGRIQRTVGQDQGVVEFLQGVQSLVNFGNAQIQRMDSKDAKAGEAARRAGLSGKEKASAAWQEGYMRADAALSGDRDGEDLIEGYHAGQADGMGVDAYLQQAYNQKTKGIEDGPFREAYDAAFAAKADRLRALDFDKRRDFTVAKAEADAQGVADKVFGAYADREDPADIVQKDSETTEEYQARLYAAESAPKFPQADEMEAMWKQAKAVGISGKRWNEMLLSTANTFGNRGMYWVYDALKQDRADGTPPMYKIPEFKRLIDEGQQSAERVSVELKRQENLRLKAERDARREAGLLPFYTQGFVANDPDGARKGLQEYLLKNPGLYSPDDVYKHMERFKRSEAQEETGEMREKAAELTKQMYAGKLKFTDIMKADLPFNLQGQMISRWNVYQEDKKGGGADKTIREFMERPEVQGVLKMMDDLDFGFKDSMGLDADTFTKARAARDSSRWMMLDAVREAALAPPDKRDAIFQERTTRALKAYDERTKGLAGRDPKAKPSGILSKSREDAIARGRRGEIPRGVAQRDYDYYQKNPQHETK